jgi:hypothetical protein
MKRMKIILILFQIIPLSVLVYAQDSGNSSKAAYGNYTLDQFFNIKSKVLPVNYSRSDLKSKGAVFVSFSHLISSHISSGVAIGSTKITSDVILNNQVVGTLNRNLYTLAIEFDFIYFKRPNFQLYGVAGYGYSFGKDEYFLDTGKTDSGYIGFMVFQVSPIAFKYGNRVAIFSELGFGYKGIANFGFSYVF